MRHKYRKWPECLQSDFAQMLQECQLQPVAVCFANLNIAPRSLPTIRASASPGIKNSCRFRCLSVAVPRPHRPPVGGPRCLPRPRLRRDAHVGTRRGPRTGCHQRQGERVREALLCRRPRQSPEGGESIRGCGNLVDIRTFYCRFSYQNFIPFGNSFSFVMTVYADTQALIA